MSIDYEQLKDFVKEAMFTGGGINEPSAPEGIPHRMPSADTWDKQQDMGDPEANKMYEVALVAREATEKLVEALDQPIFDDAYEHAFKASACLRRALNSIEQSGAHPMPTQRVVAPPSAQQKYTGTSGGGDYAGGVTVGMGNGAIGMEEVVNLGNRRVSRDAMAKSTKQQADDIGRGSAMAGVEGNELAVIQDVNKLLMQVADAGELKKHTPALEAVLKNIIRKTAETDSPAEDLGV